MKKFAQILLAALLLSASLPPLSWAQEQAEEEAPQAQPGIVALLEQPDDVAPLETTPSFDWASALSGKSATVVLGMINQYKAENSSASEQDTEGYLYSLIESDSIPSQVSPLADYMDYLPTDTSKLNSQEQVVFNSDPIAGLLCLVDAQFAVDAAEVAWNNSIEDRIDNNYDAFRHTLWNALMAYHAGSSYARSFADAHEYGASTWTAAAP
ncbi:MAG: hypothetical protein LBC35_02110 [Coriobacteriales bacterium]|nr:hypothetical protein [Coriobacteriales bacterium]